MSKTRRCVICGKAKDDPELIHDELAKAAGEHAVDGFVKGLRTLAETGIGVMQTYEELRVDREPQGREAFRALVERKEGKSRHRRKNETYRI